MIDCVKKVICGFAEEIDGTVAISLGENLFQTRELNEQVLLDDVIIF